MCLGLPVLTKIAANAQFISMKAIFKVRDYDRNEARAHFNVVKNTLLNWEKNESFFLDTALRGFEILKRDGEPSWADFEKTPNLIAIDAGFTVLHEVSDVFEKLSPERLYYYHKKNQGLFVCLLLGVLDLKKEGERQQKESL
jgi:hypothetical protein